MKQILSIKIFNHLRGVSLRAISAAIFTLVILILPGSVKATNSGIFSMELWVKPTSSIASQALVGKAEEMRMFTDASGYLGCQIKTTTWQTATTATATALTLNNWNFVACTYDKVHLTVFVNGVQVAQTSLATLPDDTAAAFKIGQDDSASTPYANLTGSVDGFEFYNYALSSKQIIADMQGAGSAQIRSVSAQSPLGYWKFDEGQGITANNSGNGGSSLNGTLTSMASPATATSGWTQSGKFGKALLFDGTNDYVTVSSGTALPTGSADRTIAFWVRSSNMAVGNTYILGWGSDANNQRSAMLMGLSDTASSKISFWGYSNDLESTSTLSNNTWYHIAFTLNGTAASIYINGVLDKSGTISGLNTPASTAFEIGKTTGTVMTPFSATIDEIKIYNYALTASEILTEYNHGSSLQLGALGTNSTYAAGAANQEYCIPGDSTSCAAPVGRWDFEEGSGSTVNDTSGNANTGTWNGTGTKHWDTGKVGKSGKFNGSDDYVDMGNNSSLNLTGQSTMEFWIYPKANMENWTNLLRKGDVYGIGVYATNKIRFWQYTPGEVDVDSDTVIELNKWTHLVGTYDGITMRLYINGKLDKTTLDSGNINVDTGIFSIQGTSWTNYINSSIDDVRIFNYARSAAQVAYDYNRGGPVGWWKFDECQGATAHDSSGNNNSGTITIGTGAGTGHIDSVGTCTTSGTAWYNGVTGKRNASMSFDGIDDYASVADNTTVLRSLRTISLWFKPTNTINSSSAERELISKRLNSGNYDGVTAGFWPTGDTNSGKIFFMNDPGAGGNTTLYSTTTSWTAGVWHNVIWTADGTNINVYIDGKLENSTAYTTAFTDAAASLYLGVLYTGTLYYFPGQIDDVKIFNYALTAQQIKDVMNNGAVNFGPVTGSP